MAETIGRRGFLKLTVLTAASIGSFGAVPAKLSWAETKPKEDASVKVTAYAFLCGILKTQTQYMLKDTRPGTPMNIPVPFFVIQHGKDWVAFDTGNNAMVAKDPVAYWSKAVTDAYFPVMKDYEEFKEQIKKLNLTPKDFKAVILSHGHLDHAGAIDNFLGTDVPIYLQQKEIDIINNAVESGKRTAYIPEDFKVMNKLNIKPIGGVFDVFGDGTIVAFPTPGHTEGHQSLLIKQSHGQSSVFAADAMYTIENMHEAIPPGLAWDIPQSLEALYVFKVMQMIGAHVVPSHDPQYWEKKPLGPKPYQKGV